MIWLLVRMFERRHPGATHPDSRLMTFMRGLAIGALVGATIAGSSIWRRRNRDS